MRMHTVLSALAAAALLAGPGMGRAIAQEAQHDHQHQGQSASTGSADKTATPAKAKAAANAQQAAAHEGTMDMKAMCDMHRQMMSRGSQAERDAMADKAMKGMSAEQKQQHMKMMDETCQ